MKPGLRGRADGRLEPADGLGVLGADRDDRLARRRSRRRRSPAPSMTRVRVALEQVPVGAGRRVRAVAVGDDVPPGRLGRGRGPPLLAGREAGAAAAAQARRGDRGDRRGRPEVADRRAQALEGAGRDRRVEVESGRRIPARSSRIVGQPLGVLRAVAMRHASAPAAVVPAAERGPERRQVGRSRPGGGRPSRRPGRSPRRARSGGGGSRWPCRRSSRTRRRSAG